MPVEALDGRGVRTSVEVTDKDDCVGLIRLLGDQLQDVVCGGFTAAAAAGAHWQRAMVIDKHHRLVGLALAQTCPHGRSGAVPLVRPVLAHIRHAIADKLPCLLPVCDTKRMGARQAAELGCQPGVAEHPGDALALLETHDVVGNGLGVARNKVPGGASIAVPTPEEVPPEEVVRQDFELEAGGAAAAAPDSPARPRFLHAAPVALPNYAVRGLPAEPHAGVRRDGAVSSGVASQGALC
mmetsp:Transcript_66994/g.193580  ORF Transcript_66994/g.193580 Transcript_66994/m.193580 type:complete len:239 (-) Transcript_66994:586-1302(-)